MARRRTQNPKPLTLGEFIKSKIVDYEAAGKEITLGTLIDGIWQEYTKGETWNCVRIGSVWEEPKYITIETLEKEWNFYIEQFENRMNKILGVYLTSFLVFVLRS